MISDDTYTLTECDGRYLAIFSQNGKISMSYSDNEADAIEKCWILMEGAKDTPYFIIIDPESNQMVGPVMKSEICRFLNLDEDEFDENVSKANAQNQFKI